MSLSEESPPGSNSEEPDNLRKGLLGKDAPEGLDDAEGGTISISQILSLKERFDSADTDGGGSLDLQEFMDAFGSIINKDGSMSDEQIKRLFMQIDANSDGGIDWNEFSTYMLMESLTGDSVTSLKAANFYLLDTAGQRQSSDHFHRDFVECSQIDPSGMHYITSAKDGTIRLWGQISLQLMKTIHLGQTWVLAMTALPVLGRLAVSTDDRKIRFYDIHTWEILMEVELQNPALCLCSWKHADTEMFAYGNDLGEITIVDLGKGLKPAKQLESQTAARKQVKRTKSWVESRTRIVHDGWVNQICKVDDLGGLVSCGSDNAITIFEVPFRTNAENKERVVPRRVLQHTLGHKKGVKCFEWVQTFKLIVSGGLERELVVWNPYTGKPVLSLSGHTSGIKMMQLYEDHEQLISLSMDRVLKVWDLRNNDCIQTITEFKKSTMKPTSFVVDKARHRMVSFGQRHQVFRINPQILNNTIEDTHRVPVVAVLYNRIFGNVVTVAEDSECSVWRPVTGELIFTFFDTERNNEMHVTCANFDEAGRRLFTGDHHGVVRVWNFNNGACIKTLAKPNDPQSRQEITAICCYVFDDKRFIAASSWDRKVTVWMDFSEDSGVIMPCKQMQGQDTDLLSVAFTYPKSLAAACADGSVGVFDVESGYKKMHLVPEKTTTDFAPGKEHAALGNSQFVEKIIFLHQHNNTMLSAGADGFLRFWEGQWMPIVPSRCSTSVAPSHVACQVHANHSHGAAIVDVETDDENRILVTADEAGFVKTWDISSYDWKQPHPDQVQPISLWQAHEISINCVDIMVPSNVEENVDYEVSPLVFTCANDKCAMLWTVDGAHVGKFGQPLQGRALPWNLHDKSTWQSPDSLDILGEEMSQFASPLSRQSYDSESSDEDHFNEILNDLDERLRAKAPSKPKFASSCFEGKNGLPVAKLDEVPAETMSKVDTKKKGKDYVVDEITGERIYKTSHKKAAVGEEKRKPLSLFMRNFTKTFGSLYKTPRPGDMHEDPKEIEKRITDATATALLQIYDSKEQQGWGEPDAVQKDVLCTKIRHALERNPDAHVNRLAKSLCSVGSNWDEMLSQADLEQI